LPYTFGSTVIGMKSTESDSGIEKAMVFNIQRFCLHDGPGIRTTIFLKGCPLLCQWCANPEALNPYPELGFAIAACNRCGKCTDVCSAQAIRLDAGGTPQIDRKLCTVCGDCIDVCFPQALAIYGRMVTENDVFREVQRDVLFYDTNGGVTLSGGEPLQQSSFVLRLFAHCRHAGISTAIETSGFVAAEVLDEVLKVTDFVLFDLKHMDPDEHIKFTGKPCGLILENARKASESKAQVQFRMPVIPGMNSGRDNINATAHFLRQLQKDDASIELMPYHRLGIGKYEALDKVYHLHALSSPDPLYIAKIKDTFEGLGVRCLISR
jgi:pyruvate formate lyase activating enzyme